MLALPHGRGASGGGWGSPPVGAGQERGRVPWGWVAGWGSSASRPLSSAASGHPGGGLCSLSFPGFLQGRAESPRER